MADDAPLVIDSVTRYAPDAAGRVCVGASHGGVYAAYLCAAAGLRGVVLHDAGIGRDGAGIAGLAYLDAHAALDIGVHDPSYGHAWRPRYAPQPYATGYAPQPAYVEPMEGPPAYAPSYGPPAYDYAPPMTGYGYAQPCGCGG